MARGGEKRGTGPAAEGLGKRRGDVCLFRRRTRYDQVLGDRKGGAFPGGGGGEKGPDLLKEKEKRGEWSGVDLILRLTLRAGCCAKKERLSKFTTNKTYVNDRGERRGGQISPP